MLSFLNTTNKNRQIKRKWRQQKICQLPQKSKVWLYTSNEHQTGLFKCLWSPYKWVRYKGFIKNLISSAHEIWRGKDSLIKVGKLKYRKSKFTSASAEENVEDFCNTFLTKLNTELCEATAENESNINLVLRKLCVSYPDIVIIGHLNINSIWNKRKNKRFNNRVSINFS